jgi:hypothetical protein
MKAKRLLGALLTAGLTLAVAMQATDVEAKGKDKEEAPPADTPVTKKAIPLTLAGVGFGQSPRQVGEALDKLVDDDYRPRYREVQPGIEMTNLDAQVAEEKSQFRRSRVDFGKLPTGLDGTPLRGEFTYNNKEAMMSCTRKGELVYFFFIQERLWKIIEEKKLAEGGPLGKSYMEAVVKLSTNYGIPGRVRQPDGTTVLALEVDWKDATTHLRAVQRSDTALGLAYEDNGTVANLSSLRPNKAVVDNGIDPDVAAMMRPPDAAPGPPPDAKKDPKKK